MDNSARNALDDPNQKVHSRWNISFAVLCLINAIEGADLVLLPSSFRALEADLGLRPTNLACIALCQGVANSLSSPIWGNLADHGKSRKYLMIFATMVWGVATGLLAFTTQFPTMVMLRIINGLGLGAVSPLAQSLIADQAEPSERGSHFGLLGFFKTSVGAVFTGLIVTSVSNLNIYGVSGWRVAYGAVGTLSLMTTVAFACFFKEPARQVCASGPGILLEIRKMFGYFQKIPTFSVFVCQGVFGCIPFVVISFQTMFYQYLGISDVWTAAITALSTFGAGAGYFAGGMIGDFCAKWNPDHGRIYVAQASTLLGLPLVFSIFVLAPHDNSHVYLYAFLSMALGMVSSWCDAGCNRPHLIDVVPASSRASVFTWVYAIEWTASQSIALPAFTFMSEMAFGYQARQQQVIDMPEDKRRANAEALGHSLVLSMTVPWVISCLIYHMAHYTLKSDRIHNEREADSLVAGSLATSQDKNP